jgi:hypothetical protein
MKNKHTQEIVDVLLFTGYERTKDLIKEADNIGFVFLERTEDNTLYLMRGNNRVILYPGNRIVRYQDGTCKAFDWKAEKDFLTI